MFGAILQGLEFYLRIWIFGQGLSKGLDFVPGFGALLQGLELFSGGWSFVKAAGPKSLVNYFKKVHFWVKSGTKSFVRQYQAKFAKTVPEHLKVCHI